MTSRSILILRSLSRSRTDDWGLHEMIIKKEELGSYRWEAPIKDYDRESL